MALQPVRDNTLIEDPAGALSNGAGDIFVGQNSKGNLVRRGLVAFDVAGSIPAGAVIHSATLTMYVTQTQVGDVPVGLHSVLANWGEAGSSGAGTGGPAQPGDATWLYTFYNGQTWTNAGGDFRATASAIQTIGAQAAFYQWTSTLQLVTDVQGWLDQPGTNFGWLLQADELQTTAKRFASREGAVPTQRPLLTVAYTEPAPPQIVISDATVIEGNAGTTTVQLDVSLSVPSSNLVTVDFSTANGSANSATDFTSTAGTLSFAPRETKKTITIEVHGDEVVETDEFLQVSLSNAANATLGDPQGRVTIANDDSATLTIDDAHVAEGNSGTTSLTFTVTLSGAVDAPVQVQYGTADSTATASDNDYTAVSGTLTFVGTVGESRTITVPVRGDGKVELDEAFIVSLSSILADGRAVTLADNQGLGTIVNDDSAVLAIGDVTVTEGNAGTTATTFTVTLNAAVDVPVRVSFATADNTATWSDNDYATASGTLDFTGDAGETQTVTVLVQGDTHIESDEFFLVDISNIQAQGRDVGLADNQGQGTIINDDHLLLPSLSIGNSHVIEGDEGTRVITLTVTLDTAANGPVSVDFATADGTATGVTGGGAGSGDGDGDDDDDDDDGEDPGSRGDYIATSGTLYFAGQAGETQTIEVLVYGDEILEVDEQFFVDLTNSIGATVGVGRGIGTILDDESPSGHKRWHNVLSPLDVDDDEFHYSLRCVTRH